MCSISGFDFSDKELAKKMNKCLKYRGPDDSGTFTDNKITMGMNRLSILDLSQAGHQPMSNRDGTVWIVYNGEIYNFLEIKEELKHKYEFKSNTDTEVIIHAYEEWGFDCVKKFNGMWAFCIYDTKKNIFFISKDRIGKKPVYYFYNNEKFIFASEIKAILKHDVQKKIDNEALRLYLALGFIPAPHSIFQNIRKLGRSENLIYDIARKEINISSYCGMPDFKPIKDKKHLKRKGLGILEDSVRLRKIADVEVGTFLSGGIDSSTVSAMLVRQSDKRLHTFSIGFEDPSFDESDYSKLMAERLETNHHHEYFTMEDFEKLLPVMAQAYDEPFADPAAFPTLKVSEMARKHVTVSLTGEGGDEIFGGYALHKIASRIQTFNHIPKNLRIGGLKVLKMSPALKNAKKGIEITLESEKKFYTKIFCQDDIDNQGKKWYEKNFHTVLKKYPTLTESAIKFDLFYHTVPDKFNVKVDRAGMWNSLEIRCPFLDFRFLNFSGEIPTNYKVDFFRTKKFMKSMLKDVLPRKILRKPKKGFTPPVMHWLENDYKDIVYDKFNLLREVNILDKKSTIFLDKLEEKHKQGKLTYYTRDKSYRMFMLGQWAEEWI